MSKHFRFREDSELVIRSKEAYIKTLMVSIIIAFSIGIMIGKAIN